MSCPPVYPDETGFEELIRQPPAAGPPLPAAGPQAYASFLRRAAAISVDGFCESVVQVLLTTLTITTVSLLHGGSVTGGEAASRAQEASLLAYSFATNLANMVLLQGLTGATIGKHLLGLRVRRADGAPLGVLRALARYFAMWLSVLSFGIGFLCVLWTSRRRALHDFVAGTVVIRTGAPKETPHADESPGPV